MTTRPPIVVPGRVNDAPTYRYWGKTKPPANAERLCAVDPRTASDDPTLATLRIYGPIDSWGGYWGTSAKEVAQALDLLGSDIKKIQVRVNSGGGSVFEGIAIANLFRAHPAEVEAVVDGLAASAASVIVAACDRRVMSPGTQFMIHDVWSSAWGCNAAEMRKEAAVLDKLSDGLAELYADVAGGTREQWREVMVEETWYTATEAAAAGLVDEVAIVPNLGAAATAGDDEVDPVLEDDELLDLFDLSVFNHAGRDKAPAPTLPSASAVGSNNTPGGTAMAFTSEQLTTMRTQLGLPETADEGTIVAALAEALEERAEDPAPTRAAATPPAGMSVISDDVLAELRTSAAEGVAARQQQRIETRDRALDAAVQAGKIAARQRDDFAKLYDADPTGTTGLLDNLAAGLVPVAELGHSDPTVQSSTELAAPAGAAAFLGQLSVSLDAVTKENS
jgi:ATP-dependent protease ClpP protease subunit